MRAPIWQLFKNRETVLCNQIFVLMKKSWAYTMAENPFVQVLQEQNQRMVYDNSIFLKKLNMTPKTKYKGIKEHGKTTDLTL